MKKLILSAAIIATVIVVKAQNEDDALRYSMDRYTGTARSVALSGAVGALGGDFSSIGVNPAGVAVYRSSEFTFTPALVLNKSNSNYYGVKSQEDKYSLPFQEIGFVGTYRPMREVTKGVVSSHFSVGYNRTNSYTKKHYIQGNNLKHSLLDRFTFNSNKNEWSDFYNGLAYDKNFGLLYFQDNFGEYLNAFEYVDTNGEIKFGPQSGINQLTAIDEKGNAGEFHFGGGVNISNKVMIGGTLGINTISYKRGLQHYEEVNGRNYDDWYPKQYFEHNIGFEGLDNFTFEESLTTFGVGVNLKVGVIYKPINAIRIGAAFHSPVFYSIDDEFSTSLKGNFFDVEASADGKEYRFSPSPERYTGKQYGNFSYNFNTPFKGVGSLAFVFGSRGLVSIDYEYIDYGSMRFSSTSTDIYDKRYMDEVNKTIMKTFKQSHNLRFGVEFRPSEIFTLRGGYGLYQSPYRKDFLNTDNKHQTFSIGFGYRMNNMFIDLAYMLRHEKFIYSLYNLDDVDYKETNEPADIINNNHQVAVTLGWRF